MGFGKGFGRGKAEGAGESMQSAQRCGGMVAAFSILTCVVGIPLVVGGSILSFTLFSQGETLWFVGIGLLALAGLLVVIGIVVTILSCAGVFNKNKTEPQQITPDPNTQSVNVAAMYGQRAGPPGQPYQGAIYPPTGPVTGPGRQMQPPPPYYGQQQPAPGHGGIGQPGPQPGQPGQPGPQPGQPGQPGPQPGQLGAAYPPNTQPPPPGYKY